MTLHADQDQFINNAYKSKTFIIATIALSLTAATHVFSIIILLTKHNTIIDGNLVSFLLTQNFFLITSISLVLYSFYRTRMRIRAKAALRDIKYSHIARELETYSAERGQILSYLFNILVKRLAGESPVIEDVDKRVLTFLSYAMDHTKRVYSMITGYKCSACIKLLTGASTIQYSGIPYVRTLIRDKISTESRRKIDEYISSYPYKDNTAFRMLMNEVSSDEIFISNNLREQIGGYDNKNEAWKQYYNATIVAPIKPPHAEAVQKVIGFICVDNIEGGFDNKYCKYTLRSIATTLYFVLNAWYLVKENVDADKNKDINLTEREEVI